METEEIPKTITITKSIESGKNKQWIQMMANSQNVLMIEQTRISKASTKWETLRTSIPKSVTNILHLHEGDQLIWNLVNIDGKNFIMLQGGEPQHEKKDHPNNRPKTS